MSLHQFMLGEASQKSSVALSLRGKNPVSFWEQHFFTLNKLFGGSFSSFFKVLAYDLFPFVYNADQERVFPFAIYLSIRKLLKLLLNYIHTRTTAIEDRGLLR